MESGGPNGWRPVPECFGPTAACRWSLPVHRTVERCSSPSGLRWYCKRLSWRSLQTTPCRCGADRACDNCTRLRLIWHDCRSWGDCPVTCRVTLQCTSPINRSWVQILLGASCLHLCASVTKQYNLVPAKMRWCSAVGKVTTGLAESNGSLAPGGWLIVTCGLTACTPGSAPGPLLSNEYGKPLPLTFYIHLYSPKNGREEK